MKLDNVEETLDEFGKDVVKAAKINLGATRTVNGKRRRIDASGKLRKSLDYNVHVGKRGGFEFSIEAEDYAIYVDVGRKPGKYAPVDVIKKWIKEKPIRIRDLETGSFVKATKSRINSLAFLINRKIKEKGIAATNFLSEPFEKNFKTLPDELIEAYALDLDEFLDFALKE